MNECPQCGRVDKIEKVSAIVQKGTHQIQGQIPVSNSYTSDGWKIGTNYENYSGTQQSNLARLLTPQSPNINVDSDSTAGKLFETFAHGIQILMFGAYTLISLAAVVSAFTMAENLSDGLLRFFGGLGAATLFVGAYIWSRKNEKAKKQKQVEVSKKWQYL